MMRKLKKKIRSSRGYTLAETLMAILILLIATAIVVRGIPMAADIQRRTVDTANGQVMLSTAMSLLRDELSVARDVKCVNEDGQLKYIKYVSGSTGCIVVLYPWAAEGDDSTVHMREYLGRVTDEEAATGLDGNVGDDYIDQELVFTSDGSLRLSLGEVTVADEDSPLFVIKDLKVYRTGQDEPVSEISEFVIRAVRR